VANLCLVSLSVSWKHSLQVSLFLRWPLVCKKQEMPGNLTALGKLIKSQGSVRQTSCHGNLTAVRKLTRSPGNFGKPVGKLFIASSAFGSLPVSCNIMHVYYTMTWLTANPKHLGYVRVFPVASLGRWRGADRCPGWHPPGGWHPKWKFFFGGQIYKECGETRSDR